MSYFPHISDAYLPFSVLADPDHTCFECGEPVTAAGVSYDGKLPARRYGSILLHTKCALVMGQRLIADSYLYRREE